MPFALVLVGIVLVIAGARDTASALGTQLKADFTGDNNYTYWVLAFLGAGSVGYVQVLKPLSHMFLALLIIVIILKNGGVFDKFMQALSSGPVESKKGADATNSTGIKITDNSAAFVHDAAQSVQAGIASHANQNASANFDKVLNGVSTITKLFAFA